RRYADGSSFFDWSGSTFRCGCSMKKVAEYDKFPAIPVPTRERSAWQGWPAILDQIRSRISMGARCLAVECYPGVFEHEISAVLKEGLSPAQLVRVKDAYKLSKIVDTMVARELTDDPVFGRMNRFTIHDFADPTRIDLLRRQLQRNVDNLSLVIGTGTALLIPHPDVLIYADLPRWEIQQRQRRNEIWNLATENRQDSPAKRYKRGYFLDWRVADRIKTKILNQMDFLLDTTDPQMPKIA